MHICITERWAQYTVLSFYRRSVTWTWSYIFPSLIARPSFF